jgi:Methylase involved in ubiquinone/menaquinone biosynthesis
MFVFDRRCVRRHRDRAAATLAEHDFLLCEIGDRLLDRLNDVRRGFPRALDLGCHDGVLSRLLNGRGRIETLVQTDLSARMVAAAPGLRLAADEEALPFAPGSFDLVLSLLSLHWVNDLPGALTQLRMALKPDGLLLAAMLGGQTLRELRRSLADAELAGEGGYSPRVAPFADVRDAGGLLQRAGFALPVVDSETLTIHYSDPFRLLRDLRGMGETNAVIERRKSLSRRRTLFDALVRYRDAFADAEGRVPATFQVIYLTAWAPDPSQPAAKRPGSADARLADALDSCEVGLGEAATPNPQR